MDSVTLLRKDKVMSGVSWSLRFQQAISTWPCNNDLGSAAVQVKHTIELRELEKICRKFIYKALIGSEIMISFKTPYCFRRRCVEPANGTKVLQ